LEFVERIWVIYRLARRTEQVKKLLVIELEHGQLDCVSHLTLVGLDAFEELATCSRYNALEVRVLQVVLAQLDIKARGEHGVGLACR
jgi:hypothetical protein